MQHLNKTKEEKKANSSDEWYTPLFLVKMIKEFFGDEISLDPCAAMNNPDHTEAEQVFCKKDNSLDIPWNFKTVYCNPPYSETRIWVEKCVKEFNIGNTTELLILVKCDPAVGWWRGLNTFPFLAFDKRLYFNDGKKSAPFPSALIYMGHRNHHFAETFSKVGRVYGPVMGVYTMDEESMITTMKCRQ